MNQGIGGRWWVVLGVYVLCGLVLGLADPLLGRAALQVGFAKPGLATAACVNLVLPLLAISLGVLHPRLATALSGGILMGAAYTIGLLINYLPGPPWDVALLFNPKLAILIMASLGYDVLGTAAALITRRLKKDGVGSPPRAV